MSGTDDRLRLIVERIERLREEAKGIRDDIRDVFAEAKAVGYDTRILRTVIARRAMKPDDRAEADMVLETYEAALGGANVFIPDARPDLDALAQGMLAEQLEGIEDPAQAALLCEHVTVLLDIRAEIALLRRQESDRKKMVKAEGFLPKQLSAVVRWIEQCLKHGETNMRAGEATYHLYRGTVQSRGVTGAVDASAATQDPKLKEALATAGAERDAKLDWWLTSGKGD